MFVRTLITSSIALVLLCVGYIGYKEYQEHIEFTEFMEQSESLALLEVDSVSPILVPIRRASAEDLEAMGSLMNLPIPGKIITTDSGQKIKLALSEFEIGKKTIRVFPSGEIFSVYAPEGTLNNPDAWVIKPYDGVVPDLELGPPPNHAEWNNSSVSFHKDDIPFGETADIYGIKVAQAHAMGISMPEFEQKLANKEIIIANIRRMPLPASRSESSQRRVQLKNVPIDNGETKKESNKSTNAVVTETQGFSASNDETFVEPPGSLKENGVEVPTSDEKESNVEERYKTEKQLMDQYGIEEGLRRFREMDPDAARRFERERRGAPNRSSLKNDVDSDDQPPSDAP